MSAADTLNQAAAGARGVGSGLGSLFGRLSGSGHGQRDRSADTGVKASVRNNFTGIRVFSTYTLHLYGVETIFQSEDGKGLLTKGWNKDYHSAQVIFGTGAQSAAVMAMVHTAHTALYTGVAGVFTPTDKLSLNSGDDFLRMFKYGQVEKATLLPTLGSGAAAAAIKGQEGGVPFTYVIVRGGIMRFSQTVHKDADDYLANLLPSSKDFMSKHAVMANGATEVVYAGELYVTERHGVHVLIIDNGSGTYAPNDDHGELAKLAELMRHNFPGLAVVAKLYNQPLDEATVEAAIQTAAATAHA